MTNTTNYLPYTRFVEVTFANGAKVKCSNPRPTLVPAGEPLPVISPDIVESWVKAMAHRSETCGPVTSVKFRYRKR